MKIKNYIAHFNKNSYTYVYLNETVAVRKVSQLSQISHVCSQKLTYKIIHSSNTRIDPNIC